MTSPARKLEWTPHPVIPLPTREQLVALVAALGEEAAGRKIADLHHQREEAIRLEREDPLRHGFEPETFLRARDLIAKFDEVYLLGGNREGKTTFCVKFAVEDMVRHPNRIWAFFHSSEKSSINQQQGKVHAMLPPEWRDLGKVGDSVYVKYSKQNGFSGAQFILPNGSIGMFFNYKQDPDVLEGYELDGAWFDELVPLAFLETMAFRLGRDRRLVKLISFTPKNGYTPTVARALVHAKIVETRRAALLSEIGQHARDCPPGHLPYVMQAPKSAALFFHLGMNPYGAADKVAAELKDKPVKMIKERAYGWADKLITSALPKYGAAHHVTRARFEAIEKKAGTRYCVADPGGNKNWFIKWYFCTPQGWTIVYREWPQYNQYGDWALHPEKAGALDWRPGEAVRMEAGRGMADYRRMIMQLEGHVWLESEKRWNSDKAEKINSRMIDCRMGDTGVPSQDEGTSIISLMETPVFDAQGRELVPSMTWDEAPDTGIQEGIGLLSDAMDYDTERPIDVTNCPKWYTVDDLVHTDLAYREYTGMGSSKDALKDIIDPDRYMIKSGSGYIEQTLLRPRGQMYY